MAVALQQVGEKDYGPLVDEALRVGLPHVRMEAVEFLGSIEDLFNVPRLIRLLDDRTEWSNRVMSDVALESLRRLALQDLPPDPHAWNTWLGQQGNVQRPLPCDPNSSGEAHAGQVAAWGGWWRANSSAFRVKSRQASLDLDAFPFISPVTIGDRVAQ